MTTTPKPDRVKHRWCPSTGGNEWTPSKWTDDSITSPYEERDSKESEVLEAYNNTFSRLAANTGFGEITPLESRLITKWEKTSKMQQKASIARATEACRVVCGVFAPEDGEKLFEAIRSTDESISE